MTAASYSFTPIGVIRSERIDPAKTPFQAALNADEEARIEVDEEYGNALLALDGFDYIWVVSCFGTPEGRPQPSSTLREVPHLLVDTPSEREVGALATRGPSRPNPIALSLVRLIAVDAATIHFRGVDMIDGTAVLDVKPYVARFDRPPGDVRSGWYDTVAIPDGALPLPPARSPMSQLS